MQAPPRAPIFPSSPSFCCPAGHQYPAPCAPHLAALSPFPGPPPPSPSEPPAVGSTTLLSVALVCPGCQQCPGALGTFALPPRRFAHPPGGTPYSARHQCPPSCGGAHPAGIAAPTACRALHPACGATHPADGSTHQASGPSYLAGGAHNPA